jgi:hypothetical protein
MCQPGFLEAIARWRTESSVCSGLHRHKKRAIGFPEVSRIFLMFRPVKMRVRSCRERYPDSVPRRSQRIEAAVGGAAADHGMIAPAITCIGIVASILGTDPLCAVGSSSYTLVLAPIYEATETSHYRAPATTRRSTTGQQPVLRRKCCGPHHRNEPNHHHLNVAHSMIS